ncbi:putative transcription regulator PAB1642 [Talaromyces proteolyticus]|uniref:Transcription regulator PAB1642 n=1 Tax=Talaromyces proteolyticus TaxID=1131652 RepID=A0AAD4KJW6_9EURO|nr:putative transcription regulator PAB1642 [Talaromyces proteolyticus]KAH8692728.1 putative transcription regulator PAB1642 [Talaromyces proteolyticus]
MTSKPLTSLLTSTSTVFFDRATKHPFLKAAGQGEVTKEKLSQWLAQDRLYAQAYVRFIGGLLTKVVLPTCNPDSKKCKSPTTEQRVFRILVDSLTNIQRELEFFDEVAMEYGLDLTALIDKPIEECPLGPGVFGPEPITRAYIDLFMSASSPGADLLEGFTVLFATEYIYLHAWKYAASIMATSPISATRPSPASFSAGPEKDLDGGALRRKFIPNWSSPEFEKYVATLRDITDELAGRLKGAEEVERARGKCIGWWRQILWLEEQFWPNLDEP